MKQKLKIIKFSFQTCELFCKAYNMSETDPNAPMFQTLKKVPVASSRVSNAPLGEKVII